MKFFWMVVLVGFAYAHEGEDYLNSIRAKLGLSGLTHVDSLECAANNHAVYLTRNNIISHNQDPRREEFFTGVSAKERGWYCGYHFDGVSENISHNNNSYKESIDSLLGAIYHRFGFLDFDIDQVGAMEVKKSFVYNMGNAKLDKLCSSSQTIEPGTSYYTCSQNKVSATDYEQTKAQTRKQNPPYIIYPCDGCEVEPAFFEEIPDPLPNLSVSGYPVSIQFNSYYFPKEVIISYFKLFDTISKPLELARSYDAKNDINKKFKPNEFAIFPLKRLNFNATYIVKIGYIYEGKKYDIETRFKTKAPNATFLDSKIKVQSIASGVPYAIYFEPNSSFRGKNLVTFRYNQYVSAINSDYFDPNTILIKVDGKVGGYVEVKDSFDQNVRLNIIE